MWGFLVLNYLIVVLTLGLGWPWVMHRTLKLIAAQLWIYGAPDGAAIRQPADHGAELRRGPARHVRRERRLTMASHARYYDGETAQVHEVSVRHHRRAGDFPPADSSIVARWPVDELAVLGDTAHEAVPPVRRRQRGAADGRRSRTARQLGLVAGAGAAGRGAGRSAAGSRRSARRWSRWSAPSGAPSTTAASMQRPCCPIACRPSSARTCSTS